MIQRGFAAYGVDAPLTDDDQAAISERLAVMAKPDFNKKIDFSDVVFDQQLVMVGFVLPRWADFSRCKFEKWAHFNKAAFSQNANFEKAAFFGDAYFNETVFSHLAIFNEAAFSGSADFEKAAFSDAADFMNAMRLSLRLCCA